MNTETVTLTKEIMKLFEDSSLSVLSLSDGDFSLHLEKPSATAAAPAPAAPIVTAAPLPEEGRIVTVTSPLVGTFYAAASPDEDPYVTVGAAVHEKSTVCLIESMKVFTEIPSGVCGTVTKIFAENGDFVEYDQPLFEIRCDPA